MGDLAFLLSDCSNTERAARCRELRALSLVYLGLRHPVTIALAEAIVDPSATDRALSEINTIPALRRRRLLASYAVLMTRTRRSLPQASAASTGATKGAFLSRGSRVPLSGSDLVGTVWQVGRESVYVMWDTLSALPLGWTEPTKLILLPQREDLSNKLRRAMGR
jgi:hypothetical protein